MNKVKMRYDNLDLMKFLATLGVISLHGCCLNTNILISNDFYTHTHYAFQTLFSISVPVFFICNGFLLFGKQLDWKQHYMKTLRYLILTLIWAFITVFLLMIIRGEHLSLKELIWKVRIFDVGWVNHLWFMGAIFNIYVLFPFIKKLFEANINYFIFFTIIVSVFTIGDKSINMILSMLTNRYIDTILFDMFNPFKMVNAWSYVYFCLGGILYFYSDNIREWYNKNRIIVTIVSVCMIFGSCFLLYRYGVIMSRVTDSVWNHVWDGYDSIFVLVASIALFILCLNYQGIKNNFIAKRIGLIGRNSLGIYLIHIIFVDLTIGIVKNFSLFNTNLMQLLYSFGILLLSLVVVLFIKKIPMANRLL